MSEPDDRERLEVLEIRLAHQERAIDDLNAALTGQWDHIEALARLLEVLRERLRETERRMADAAPAEPPPPHF